MYSSETHAVTSVTRMKLQYASTWLEDVQLHLVPRHRLAFDLVLDLAPVSGYSTPRQPSSFRLVLSTVPRFSEV